MTPFCRVKWTEMWAPCDVRHGVLMSEVVHVPHDRRWTCIVATEHGNVEMDPLRLTVTGVWIPGEPLGAE